MLGSLKHNTRMYKPLIMIRLLFSLLLLALLAEISCGAVFIHLTDQHLDWEYHENTDPAVDWCHSNKKGDAGHFGSFKCHMPKVQLEASFSELKRLFPEPEFILWTGDFRRGFPTVYGRQEVLDVLTNTTELLSSYFPHTLVLPLFGNHDVDPNCWFDPQIAPTWLYPAAAKLWSRWLPDSSLSQLSRGGFYSYWSGFKPSDWSVISLHSCLWMKGNTPTQNITDPAGQFAWLEQELTAAQTRGQKVYIAGHCNPTPKGMWPQHNQMLADVVRKYSTAIEAMFWGH